MAIRVHRLTGQGTIYMKIGCKVYTTTTTTTYTYTRHLVLFFAENDTY